MSRRSGPLCEKRTVREIQGSVEVEVSNQKTRKGDVKAQSKMNRLLDQKVGETFKHLH